MTDEVVEDLMVSIAEGGLTFSQIEDWFRRHVLSPAEFKALVDSVFSDGASE